MIAKQPPEETRVVFKYIDDPSYDTSIDCYLKHGGYETLKKALKMNPDDIIAEVKTGGVRGRGGAGFPCGVKWSFINHEKNTKPVYLLCNADESEPGTFKDRHIIHKDPHQLIEGMIISAFACRVNLSYIYIRGEFPVGAKILEKAIAEAHAKGFLGKDILGSGHDLELYVHRGAGSYICGEETGLIESLEGKRPYPRIKPPYFPAVMGLYMCPTIVNNVETLCDVKHIINMGGAEFAKIGRPNNTGTRICCVSGDVQKPGYYEFDCSNLTMGQLLYDVCGGPKEGRKFKAVIPGGSSAKVMRCDDVYKVKEKGPDGEMVEKELKFDDVILDFDGLMQGGSMAGSGGFIVMDDSRNMVECLNNLNTFYAHESCGQCTPCREGSLWTLKITERMKLGRGRAGDTTLLKSVADNVAGRTICAHGEAMAWPIQSFVEHFREEFEEKGAHGSGPRKSPTGGLLEPNL